MTTTHLEPFAADVEAFLDIMNLVLQDQSLEALLMLAVAERELRQSLACLSPPPMVH